MFFVFFLQVQTLEVKDSSALTVAEDLKDVAAGMRVSFQSLSEDIQMLTKAVANIDGASSVVCDDPNDRFKSIVTPALGAKYRADLNAVVDAMRATENLYKELAEAYGENPSTMSSSEFLGIIDTFLQSMLNARKEIEAAKLKAEKAAAARAKVATVTAQKGSPMMAASPSDESAANPIHAKSGVRAAPGQAMVVDELLVGLKSGALLRNRTESRRDMRIARTPGQQRKEPAPAPAAWSLANRNKPSGAQREQARLEKSLHLDAPEDVQDVVCELGEEEQSAPPMPELPVPAPRGPRSAPVPAPRPGAVDLGAASDGGISDSDSV